MTQINFIKEVSGERIYKDFLESWCRQTIKSLKREPGILCSHRLETQELNLLFLSPQQMKRVNKEHRGFSKVTDVLSFEGDEHFLFGEILFCVDEIKKRARKQNLPLREYLAFLLTHGLLHLLSYDHEKSLEDEQLMFSLQNKVFRKVAKSLSPRYKEAFDVLL